MHNLDITTAFRHSNLIFIYWYCYGSVLSHTRSLINHIIDVDIIALCKSRVISETYTEEDDIATKQLLSSTETKGSRTLKSKEEDSSNNAGKTILQYAIESTLHIVIICLILNACLN